ncbi:hypothetical protein G2W53_034748 [Senna tora]|uniref:Uncharacterized protein n=1 Tax=Senna tora TaxID=362788 RepID=A0A834W963_9FABA|nr:hypothetical protein G2W53_034748 [Senna tora]
MDPWRNGSASDSRSEALFPIVLASKHASNGPTDPTFFIFLSEALFTNSLTSGLKMELCSLVYGATVLNVVPPFPFSSMDKREGSNLMVLPTTLIDLTVMKYSKEASLRGLGKRVSKERSWEEDCRREKAVLGRKVVFLQDPAFALFGEALEEIVGGGAAGEDSGELLGGGDGDEVVTQVGEEDEAGEGVEDVEGAGVVGATWFEGGVAAIAGERSRAVFGGTGEGSVGGGVVLRVTVVP